MTATPSHGPLAGSRPQLQIKEREQAHVVSIKETKLNQPLVDALARRLAPLTERPRPRLAFDLTGVHSLDGAALGCLMDVARRVAALEGAAVLVGLQERVAVLVRMARLHHRMPVVASQRNALTALRAALR